MVEVVFAMERVEIMRMRWDKGSREGMVRNSSMRRWQMEKPRPLGGEDVSFGESEEARVLGLGRVTEGRCWESSLLCCGGIGSCSPI